jgi:bifunctional UDP-N-acetylglucosamine pyrophosphorylase/glucosamine-1-phosphate N-acetyltransferase
VVGPNTTLTDTEVGENATVLATVATGVEIGTGVSVGPFSFLRPGTKLAAKSKVGAFVEVKNSSLGLGSKIPHLSYVGDGDIGDGTNIGAATIFVNYDGQTKSRTTVGDHAFVGCDTMLVAPVTVHDGAYVAAGSVITKDVPPGAMAVARGTQRNVEGWVARKRPDSKSAKAAAAASAAAPSVKEADSQDEQGMDKTAP